MYETYEKIPGIFVGRVEAVNPDSNQVRVNLRYPLNCMQPQWASVCQLNAGSSVLASSQITVNENDTRISNIKRTGFYVLPNVGDFVICAYVDGIPFAGNLICLGAIITNIDVKSDQGRRFDDVVIHHRSDAFMRWRSLDCGQYLKTDDSNNISGKVVFYSEDSRGEIEINNKDGSIIRMTQFKEDYNKSDDEIALEEDPESKIPPLMWGRYLKEVKMGSDEKDVLVRDRGMIQMLHNTGAKLEFRNLEIKSTENKRAKIQLDYKNNIFSIIENTLNKPEITLSQSSSSFLKFDESGNVSIDASKSNKTITINAKDSVITIENGKVTIKGNEVVIDSPDIQLGDGATEKIIKGTAFKALYNSHTHPTGVGPSGPPMTVMDSTLSNVSKTK